MQPVQKYLVTLSFQRSEFTEASYQMIFPRSPTAEDIIKGVEAANAFYTDHLGTHATFLALSHCLRDDYAVGISAGWRRTCPCGPLIESATITCQQVDFFSN